jgi:hypothetical protein
VEVGPVNFLLVLELVLTVIFTLTLFLGLAAAAWFIGERL